MTNVWYQYIKNISANFDGNLYFSILHHPRVELHCKLQEKLHHVTGPLIITSSVDIMGKWIIKFIVIIIYYVGCHFWTGSFAVVA